MLPVETLVGIFAAVAVYCGACGCLLTDGVLTRPHRVIWRIIKGLSILYLCFLVFVSFQKLENIRWALGVIDNRIGKPLPEVNYAEDCSMAQFKKSIDIFVACHFIGWLVKALIIRDFWLCWFLQILFEWMEISLRHVLPNFWECWWDHLILDVFGCNAFGIWLGMLIVNKFDMKAYRWRVHSQSWKALADSTTPKAADEKTETDKKPRGIEKLLSPPEGPKPLADPSIVAAQVEGSKQAPSGYWWTTYEWPGAFTSFESFIMISALCVTVNVLDLNLFFIKAALWIPTNHWINGSRTIFLAMTSAAASREIYEFITDKNKTRLGSQAVIGFACVYMETILAYNLRAGLPKAYPTPTFVTVAWICIATAWLCTAVFLFRTRRIKWFTPVDAARAAGIPAVQAEKVVEEALKLASPLPAEKKKQVVKEESSDDDEEELVRKEPPVSAPRNRKQH